jgi:hypothetical protein
MRHTERPDFSKAKFTPGVIANKKQIEPEELRAFFLDNHSISDCAKRFGCSEVTIKRHLRAINVDTSIYNHSQLAKDRSGEHHRVYKLSDDDLGRLFIDENLDTKTIAEMQDPPVHFNVVRKHIRRLGLKKDRKAVARSMSARHIRQHGYRHPAQRPDVLAKTRLGWTLVEYVDVKGRTFKLRSLHELYYALLLDKRGVEWYYEEMRIPYIDALTGKNRIYIVDFTVILLDGSVEWIEVKPNDGMVPSDKRVFAARCAEEAGVIYRGNNASERCEALKLFESGYRVTSYKYLNWKQRPDTKETKRCFKDEVAARRFRLRGWRRMSFVRKCNHLYVVRLRRVE